jgi:hypothetical protein
MIRLAIETENGVIRQGEAVMFLVKGEEKPRTGTLNQAFTSVHEPHYICFGVAEEPYHKTHCVTDIEFIDSAEGNEPTPLTVEELKERNGKPIWIKHYVDDVLKTPFDEPDGWIICNLDKLPKSWWTYGETWLAYDHEPKEANHE